MQMWSVRGSEIYIYSCLSKPFDYSHSVRCTLQKEKRIRDVGRVAVWSKA